MSSRFTWFSSSTTYSGRESLAISDAGFFYEFDTFSFTQPTTQMHLQQQQQQQPFYGCYTGQCHGKFILASIPN